MTNNPVRGCGQLKPGGFYLQGESIPGGMLRKLTWVLGTLISETSVTFDNLYTAASKRAMTFFNPAASLALCRLAHTPGGLPDDHYAYHLWHDLREGLGSMGLLDFVGASYYTPWSFAVELAQHGPSRKVSEDVMHKIVPELPLPVFFTHPKMPLFAQNNDVLITMGKLGLNPDDYWKSPTWIRPGWGMSTDDKYDGSEHFSVPILEFLDEHKPKYGYEEMVFCASWFTKGIYVMTDDDDLKRVKGNNLETLRLLPDGEAEVV